MSRMGNDVDEREIERLAKLGAEAAKRGRNGADHWLYQGTEETAKQRERDRKFVRAVLAGCRTD